MAIKIASLADAIKLELDTTVTVAVKILEISDYHEYVNSSKDSRRYKIIRVADESANLEIRVYSQKLIMMVEAGKCYLLTNLLKKNGNQSLWAVKSSGGCEWTEIKNVRTEATTRNERTALAEAVISPGVSNIGGKILQVSPLKYMRNGELPLRFVRLQDKQEGPRVKVALFGNEACKDYSSGDNISVTDVYKYKDTNTLSTKKSCKTEFLPETAFGINVDGIEMPEDKDFDQEPESDTPECFTVKGVASVNMYECCPSGSCRNKKLQEGKCPQCQKTPLVKKTHYCNAEIYIERAGDIYEYRLFKDQLDKLFDVPDLSGILSNYQLQQALHSQVPINAQGLFRSGTVNVVTIKRKP